MAWTTEATHTYDDLGVSSTVRLEVVSGPAQGLDLPVIGSRPPTVRLADEQSPPLVPTMAQLAQLDLYDEGRQILSILDSHDAENVRLTIERSGSVWYRGTLYKIEGGDKQERSNPRITLKFDDLARLKAFDWQVRGAYTLGELCTILLDQTGLDLPVSVYSNWRGLSSAGNNSTVTPRSESLRLVADDLGSSVTYWGALRALLKDKNLQVFQEDGEWYVIQRSYRTGSMEGARRTSVSASPATVTNDFTVSYDAADWLHERDDSNVQLERANRKAEGVQTRRDFVQAGFAPKDSLSLSATSPVTGEETWEGWRTTANVDSEQDNSGDTKPKFDAINHGFDTNDPAWMQRSLDQPLAAGDSIRVVSNAVATLQEPPSGDDTVQVVWGDVEIWRTDGTLRQTTEIKAENVDAPALLGEVDVTFQDTIGMPDFALSFEQYEVRVRLYGVKDPDSDAETELNAIRVDDIRVEVTNEADDTPDGQSQIERLDGVTLTTRDESGYQVSRSIGTQWPARKTFTLGNSSSGVWETKTGADGAKDEWQPVSTFSGGAGGGNQGTAIHADAAAQVSHELRELTGYVERGRLQFRDTLEKDGNQYLITSAERTIQRKYMRVRLVQLATRSITSDDIRIEEGETRVGGGAQLQSGPRGEFEKFRAPGLGGAWLTKVNLLPAGYVKYTPDDIAAVTDYEVRSAEGDEITGDESFSSESLFQTQVLAFDDTNDWLGVQGDQTNFYATGDTLDYINSSSRQTFTVSSVTKNPNSNGTKIFVQEDIGSGFDDTGDLRANFYLTAVDLATSSVGTQEVRITFADGNTHRDTFEFQQPQQSDPRIDDPPGGPIGDGPTTQSRSNLTDGEVIISQGHTEPDDGLGSIYRYDAESTKSTSERGVYALDNLPGRLLRIKRDDSKHVLDVTEDRSFAYGDRSSSSTTSSDRTNNRQQLQALIDEASGGERLLRLPNKVIEINSPLKFYYDGSNDFDPRGKLHMRGVQRHSQSSRNLNERHGTTLRYVGSNTSAPPFQFGDWNGGDLGAAAQENLGQQGNEVSHINFEAGTDEGVPVVLVDSLAQQQHFHDLFVEQTANGDGMICGDTWTSTYERIFVNRDVGSHPYTRGIGFQYHNRSRFGGLTECHQISASGFRRAVVFGGLRLNDGGGQVVTNISAIQAQSCYVGITFGFGLRTVDAHNLYAEDWTSQGIQWINEAQQVNVKGAHTGGGSQGWGNHFCFGMQSGGGVGPSSPYTGTANATSSNALRDTTTDFGQRNKDIAIGDLVYRDPGTANAARGYVGGFVTESDGQIHEVEIVDKDGNDLDLFPSGNEDYAISQYLDDDTAKSDQLGGQFASDEYDGVSSPAVRQQSVKHCHVWGGNTLRMKGNGFRYHSSQNTIGCSIRGIQFANAAGGTNTATSTNQLVDSNATFVDDDIVRVGDKVTNRDDGSVAYVDNIVDNNTLDLAADDPRDGSTSGKDIFTSTGVGYGISGATGIQNEAEVSRGLRVEQNDYAYKVHVDGVTRSELRARIANPTWLDFHKGSRQDDAHTFEAPVRIGGATYETTKDADGLTLDPDSFRTWEQWSAFTLDASSSSSTFTLPDPSHEDVQERTLNVVRLDDGTSGNTATVTAASGSVFGPNTNASNDLKLAGHTGATLKARNGPSGWAWYVTEQGGGGFSGELHLDGSEGSETIPAPQSAGARYLVTHNGGTDSNVTVSDTTGSNIQGPHTDSNGALILSPFSAHVLVADGDASHWHVEGTNDVRIQKLRVGGDGEYFYSTSFMEVGVGTDRMAFFDDGSMTVKELAVADTARVFPSDLTGTTQKAGTNILLPQQNFPARIVGTDGEGVQVLVTDFGSGIVPGDLEFGSWNFGNKTADVVWGLDPKSGAEKLYPTSEPPDPPNGEARMWVADGSGSHSFGDRLLKVTDSGGTTTTVNLSAGGSGATDPVFDSVTVDAVNTEGYTLRDDTATALAEWINESGAPLLNSLMGKLILAANNTEVTVDDTNERIDFRINGLLSARIENETITLLSGGIPKAEWRVNGTDPELRSLTSVLALNASELLLDTGEIRVTDTSSDPTDPSSGEAVVYVSDGTDSGDEGDVRTKYTDAGGDTTHETIHLRGRKILAEGEYEGPTSGQETLIINRDRDSSGNNALTFSSGTGPASVTISSSETDFVPVSEPSPLPTANSVRTRINVSGTTNAEDIEHSINPNGNYDIEVYDAGGNGYSGIAFSFEIITYDMEPDVT